MMYHFMFGFVGAGIAAAPSAAGSAPSPEAAAAGCSEGASCFGSSSGAAPFFCSSAMSSLAATGPRPPPSFIPSLVRREVAVGVVQGLGQRAVHHPEIQAEDEHRHDHH